MQNRLSARAARDFWYSLNGIYVGISRFLLLSVVTVYKDSRASGKRFFFFKPALLSLLSL